LADGVACFGGDLGRTRKKIDCQEIVIERKKQYCLCVLASPLTTKLLTVQCIKNVEDVGLEERQLLLPTRLS
jgi:hypothetical protein